MKNTVLLAILLSIFQLSFGQVKTSGKLLAGNVAKESSAKPVIIRTTVPANVKFPSILEDHIEESKAYIETFSKNRRDYLIRTHKNGKKLFPKVVTILKKHNLPQELKVLMALESAFNPNARSSAGAFGYWQFMDEVAREYGLAIGGTKTVKVKGKTKKVVQKDDRSNFLKSTNAAARYLLDRKRNLNNDWLLVVASYNWGVGNVWEAIRKTGKSNATFWDIKKYLPSETKAYVMNFIALNVIFNNYDNFLNKDLQFEDKVIETVETMEEPGDPIIL